MADALAERFAQCLAEVLRHEGGYADHPQDPGGATNLGITRKTLARWRRVSPWWKLPKAEVRALGAAEAAMIYRAGYWEPVRAGTLPPGLDLALFDFAVNSGPGRAVKTLQGHLKVAADGLVGPVTLAAIEAQVRETGTGRLIDALCDRRLSFLGRLSSFAVFGRGWTRRVAAIRATAHAAAPKRISSSITTKSWRQNMDFLSGYRTYIVAAAMATAGLAQLLGIDLPAVDGNSAGQLILEAFAIVFLRKGIKADIGNA